VGRKAQYLAQGEHEQPKILRGARLAHHFTEAGLVERAVEYWLKAGRHALTRSAMSEAEALLRKGLTLVASGADGVRGPEHELALLICFGQALFATKGWAAAGVTEAYARARQLCDQLGNTQRLLPILYGQWINHAMRGDMDRAQELAADIRQLGKEQGSSIASLMGFCASGFTSLHLGEFSVARVHLERGIELFDPLQRRQYLELTPIDALVFLSTQLCLAMACYGVLNQAQLHRDQGISEARQLAQCAHIGRGAVFFLESRLGHSRSSRALAAGNRGAPGAGGGTGISTLGCASRWIARLVHGGIGATGARNSAAC
jgi:hypothetical protein